MWPPLSSSQEWWGESFPYFDLSAFLFCFQEFTWLHWAHLCNPASLPYFKVNWLVILLVIASAKSLLPHNNITTRLTPGLEIIGIQRSAYLSPPYIPQNSYPSYRQNTFTPLLSFQKFYHITESQSQSKTPKSHDLVQMRFWVDSIKYNSWAQFFSICSPRKLKKQINCSQHRKTGQA